MDLSELEGTLPTAGGNRAPRFRRLPRRPVAPSNGKPCYAAPGVEGMRRGPSVAMRWIWALPLVALLSTLTAVPAAAHPVGIGALSATEPRVFDTLLAQVGPSAAAIVGWVWMALLALTAVLAVRRWPRPSALALAALLVWFVGQATAHSVGHWGATDQAEHCPVCSASQHLASADPELNAPDPSLRLPSGVALPSGSPGWVAPVVLDGQHPRAPPA